MAPAGWYPVWDGRQERWWDGTAWSDHVRDPQPAVQGELVTQEPSRPNRTVGRVTDLATASHQTRSLPEGTLWSAVGKPLTGFGAGRYRLDSQFLYYEEGTLRTDSQQVQVVYVHDIDVKQSMSQKARNVFTVIVHAGGQLVKLEDIEDGYRAQQRINDAAHAARLAKQQRDTTVRYEGTSPHAAQVNIVQASTPPSPASTSERGASTPSSGDDLLEKLTKLAELRSDGILTESEFVAAKARLLS